MNKVSIFTLKVLRRLYKKTFNRKELNIDCEKNPDHASEIIYNLLSSDKPCMIARFGSTELNAISNYWSIQNHPQQYWKYIKGEIFPWWWNKKGLEEIYSCSGFFPATIEKVSKFAEMMIEDMPLVDILGSWRPEERFFNKELINTQKVHLQYLEPFWSTNAWSKALKGKKILVVHPFAEMIANQYKNRDRLFDNPDILPEFESLNAIKAVQSLGGDSNTFSDWFEALDWMKKEIDKEDYDICLIGCGAYGFPLAAHVKRQEKKAIHLGGALQLLFGIRGKRWEDPNYGVKEWGIPYGSYSSLMNEYWVRPGNSGRPKNAEQVEGACYW